MSVMMSRSSYSSTLIEKFLNRSAVVGVIGMGYVGLPFAVEKAKMGFPVIGVEQNPCRADKINSGESYIPDVDSAELADLVGQGLIRAVTDFSLASEMDAIIICVPTPLTKHLTPDLRYVESVTAEIAKRLRPGQFVCLESTTYPGTTEELMLPLLSAAGLIVEEEFFLAHSPERVDPGNKRYTTKNTNKVVGGIGPVSLHVARTFYQQTVEQVIAVSHAKVAEMVKVYENTFRAVNIALVNEMLLLCDRMDISVWEVLEAAFTKPFGILPFFPGPGVGGHCIPIDPHYLEWKAKEVNFQTQFISLAGEINRKMPSFVKEKAGRLLNGQGRSVSGSRLLVVGIAYKRDLGDCRESPAIEVMKLLMREGAEVIYHDPYVPSVECQGVVLESRPLTPEVVQSCDLVIIATDHSEVDYETLVRDARHVLDTRNAAVSVKHGRERITPL